MTVNPTSRPLMAARTDDGRLHAVSSDHEEPTHSAALCGKYCLVGLGRSSYSNVLSMTFHQRQRWYLCRCLKLARRKVAHTPR